jgi:hypothetical protein
MSQAAWQGTVDVLKQQGALTADLKADDLFTDKFLQ